MNDYEMLYRVALEVSPERDLITTRSSCGGVGAAILTSAGNVYSSICIDMSSGIGFCAEHADATEMLKDSESHVVAMLAVRYNGKVLPPCGRCREMIAQCDIRNREALVYVAADVTQTLEELLPHNWIDV